MNNIKLEKNKIIGIIIIIVSLIIFIYAISLSNDYKKLDKYEGNLKQEIKSQIKEENINSKIFNNKLDKGEIEIKIYDLISDFYYKINSKNFDKAYNMINQDYKTDTGLTFLDFKNRYDIKDNLIFKIENIENVDNHYIAEVITYRDSYKNIYKSKQYFTIFLDEKPSLIDIGVKNIEEINYINETEDLIIKCSKKYKLARGYLYTVSIINKTPHIIQIKPNEEGIYGIDKEKKYKIPHKLINSFNEMYDIPPNPNNPKNFNLLFNKEVNIIKAQIGIIEDLNVINSLNEKEEENKDDEKQIKTIIEVKYTNPYELNYKEIYFLNKI